MGSRQQLAFGLCPLLSLRLPDTMQRGDLVVTARGVLSARPNCQIPPNLIMDFTLDHTYTSRHVLKRNTLEAMEQDKCESYTSKYHEQGLAFAPLAANTFGQSSSASSGHSLIMQPGIMFQLPSLSSQSCPTLHPVMIITLLRLFADSLQASSGSTLCGVPFAPAHSCLRSNYPSRLRWYVALAESGPVLGELEPSLFALVCSITALLATSGCSRVVTVYALGRTSHCPSHSLLPLSRRSPANTFPSAPCHQSSASDLSRQWYR